jgi:hypothetical protein
MLPSQGREASSILVSRSNQNIMEIDRSISTGATLKIDRAKDNVVHVLQETAYELHNKGAIKAFEIVFDVAEMFVYKKPCELSKAIAEEKVRSL